MSPRSGVFGLLLALAAGAAGAHTGSTAYLQAVAEGPVAKLRADYALADLDDAVGLDGNDDGAITWGEVQTAAPAVLAWLAPQLAVLGDGEPCALVAGEPVQIAEHGDGPYAVFHFSAHCGAEPRQWTLRDAALFAFDANHRVFARWQRGGEQTSAVLTPQRQELALGSTGSTPFATLETYWHEGLAHVWSGWDHLLFIAGLFLAAALIRAGPGWQPAPQLKPALLDSAKLVTAFTLAHALTLCLTALGVVALPTRVVESLVALSVLFAGANNLWPVVSRRGLFALAWVFGLIHGSAIAGALLELGLPPQGRALALLGFNLGVEVAQLLLVAVLVPLAFSLRRWRGYVPLLLWPGSLVVSLAGLVWFVDRAFGMGWPLPI